MHTVAAGSGRAKGRTNLGMTGEGLAPIGFRQSLPSFVCRVQQVRLATKRPANNYLVRPRRGAATLTERSARFRIGHRVELLQSQCRPVS